jgi:hypothetical protein
VNDKTVECYKQVGKAQKRSASVTLVLYSIIGPSATTRFRGTVIIPFVKIFTSILAYFKVLTYTKPNDNDDLQGFAIFPEYALAHSISQDITVTFVKCFPRVKCGVSVMQQACDSIGRSVCFSADEKLEFPKDRRKFVRKKLYTSELFLQLQLIRLFTIQKIDNIFYRLSPKHLSLKIHETCKMR